MLLFVEQNLQYILSQVRKWRLTQLFCYFVCLHHQMNLILDSE